MVEKDSTVLIDGRKVGRGSPSYIIAEAGVNHNGDVKLAKMLIEEAVRAGADAVKFQSFITEELITPETPKADYQVETTGEAGSQYNMLKTLELTEEEQAELKAHCDKNGIVYICTPYDMTSVDMLDAIDVAAYKIASTDTTNIPFLRYVAGKARPVILSTGMSTLGEVEEAVKALKGGGGEGKIVILHCTSEYPATAEEANLRAIQTMERAFGCPVGFSDHTPGKGISPLAVAAGACMVEKHFTLDREMTGPDHRASMEPAELAELVKAVREVESALGDGVKRPTVGELKNKPKMQKSIVARRRINKGDTILAADITCKRPGTGLRPALFDNVVGKKAAEDIPKDGIMTDGSIEWGKK